MFGYFNMLLNFLQLFLSFLFYVRKRWNCVTNEYLNKACVVPNSETYDQPSSEIPKWDTAILTNKKFSWKVSIFHPKIAEIRLFNGFVSGLKTLRSRRSVEMEQQYAKFKTASSMDELKVKYTGSIKFMTRKVNFTAKAALENVKIFTKFTICPYTCESVFDNIHIDDIKLLLDTPYFSLDNNTSNFVLSAILKIVSFFILCLFEFVIGFHLKSKFRKNDFFQIDPEKHDFKFSLCEYMKNTRIVNKYTPTKYFITALSDVLIEDNRNMLFKQFPEFLDASDENLFSDSSDITLVDEIKDGSESGDSDYEGFDNRGSPENNKSDITLVPEEKKDKDSGNESDKSSDGSVKKDGTGDVDSVKKDGTGDVDSVKIDGTGDVDSVEKDDTGYIDLVKKHKTDIGSVKKDGKKYASSDEKDNVSDAGSDEKDNVSDAGSDEKDNISDASSDESEVTTDVPDTESESGLINYYYYPTSETSIN